MAQPPAATATRDNAGKNAVLGESVEPFKAELRRFAKGVTAAHREKCPGDGEESYQHDAEQEVGDRVDDHDDRHRSIKQMFPTAALVNHRSYVACAPHYTRYRNARRSDGCSRPISPTEVTILGV